MLYFQYWHFCTQHLRPFQEYDLCSDIKAGIALVLEAMSMSVFSPFTIHYIIDKALRRWSDLATYSLCTEQNQFSPKKHWFHQHSARGYPQSYYPTLTDQSLEKSRQESILVGKQWVYDLLVTYPGLLKGSLAFLIGFYSERLLITEQVCSSSGKNTHSINAQRDIVSRCMLGTKSIMVRECVYVLHVGVRITGNIVVRECVQYPNI